VSALARVGADRLIAYGRMARHAHGKPFSDWPAWSTGETLIVALVLNRHDVLDAMSHTICEALDRVDLTVADLRFVERQLQARL
jgi:hypothetical protein